LCCPPAPPRAARLPCSLAATEETGPAGPAEEQGKDGDDGHGWSSPHMATTAMDGAPRTRRRAGQVELGSSSPASNASMRIGGGAAAMEHRRSPGVAMASWAKGATMAMASLRRSGAARRQRARGGARLEVLHGGGERSSSARLQRRLSFSLFSRRVAAAPLLPPLLLGPARLLCFRPRGQLVWVRRLGVTARRGSDRRGRRRDAQAAWRGRPRRIRARAQSTVVGPAEDRGAPSTPPDLEDLGPTGFPRPPAGTPLQAAKRENPLAGGDPGILEVQVREV
jgi:hypothetical protein